MFDFFKPKKYYDQDIQFIANEVPDKPSPDSVKFLFAQLIEGEITRNDWKIKVNIPEGKVFLVFHQKTGLESLDKINELFDIQYKIIEVAEALSQLESDGMIFSLREVEQKTHCSGSVFSSGPAIEEGQAIYLEIVDKRVVGLIVRFCDVGIYKTKKLKKLQANSYVSDEERHHSHQMNMMFWGVVVSLFVGVLSSLATFVTA